MTPPPAALSARTLIWTLEPCRSRSWPSVTTRSPGLTSPLTMAIVAGGPAHLHRPGGRGAVGLDHEHEAALLARRPRPRPAPPARSGRRTGGAARSRTRRARARRRSLGKLPLSRMVPVVVSTALSMKASVPSLGSPPAGRLGTAMTASFPRCSLDQRQVAAPAPRSGPGSAGSD